MTATDEIEQLLLTDRTLDNSLYLDLSNTPCTWKEGQQSADAKHWENACKEEIDLLKSMQI